MQFLAFEIGQIPFRILAFFLYRPKKNRGKRSAGMVAYTKVELRSLSVYNFYAIADFGSFFEGFGHRAVFFNG